MNIIHKFDYALLVLSELFYLWGRHLYFILPHVKKLLICEQTGIDESTLDWEKTVVILHPSGYFDNAPKAYQHIEVAPLAAAMGA
ncbi:MAG: hypothetical protein AAF512_19450, partial [Pseudomonadota bacterium]